MIQGDPRIVILISIIVIILCTAVRVVKEYHRLVIFRIGRFSRVAGPGLVVTIPFLEKAFRLDTREITNTLEVAELKSSEGRKVSIEVDYRWRVVDPAKAVIEVENYIYSLAQQARQARDEIVPALPSSHFKSKRESVETQIRDKLQDVVTDWGIEIAGIDIRLR